MLKRLFYRKEFDRIFTENYTRLYMYALHLTGDPEVSKDIVSDVFTGVWNKFSIIDTLTIRPYLTTSVYRKCVDHWRHLSVIRKFSDEYLKTTSCFYLDYSKEEEEDKLIGEMLSKLPAQTRTILEECFLNQKKYEEVALELKISPNTVKKHITKALKILRSTFNDEKVGYDVSKKEE